MQRGHSQSPLWGNQRVVFLDLSRYETGVQSPCILIQFLRLIRSARAWPFTRWGLKFTIVSGLPNEAEPCGFGALSRCFSRCLSNSGRAELLEML